jgi:hypothetical protein
VFVDVQIIMGVTSPNQQPVAIKHVRTVQERLQLYGFDNAMVMRMLNYVSFSYPSDNQFKEEEILTYPHHDVNLCHTVLYTLGS